MKSTIKFLVLPFIFFITPFSYSQTKGQVHLGIGSAVYNISTLSGNTGITGSLYNNYESGSNNTYSSSTFSFLVGYFAVNKLRLDGGFSINVLEETDAAIYFNLGTRYFYYANKKILLNGGITGNFGITNGTERSNKKPVNLNITPIEFQFWPFEGGAVTTDFTYTFVFLNGGGNNSEKSYGLNVGLLIRLN